MPTDESSKPFKKHSAEESEAVLSEVAWMAKNGALRFKSDEAADKAEAAAEVEARRQAEAEKTAND